MHSMRTLLAVAFLAGSILLGRCADATIPAAVTNALEATAHAAEAAHGLPPNAVELGKIGPLPITNSMVVTLVVALLLIIVAQLATRNVQLIPSGLQNFWEYLVESLYSFLEGLLGKELVKKTFWFFASLFLFILFTNWFGLIPGVGTLGWGHMDAAGHFHISEPLLRGGNADLNTTSALAMLFFLLWTVWALQALGVGGLLKHIFGAQGESHGFMKLFMIAVFFFVGVIEVISILFRPVSLSFRLFGNVFAGENILESMAHLGGPMFGWLLPLPFYFLELLVGLVQALVFTLLTAVFTALMCQHHSDDHAHAEQGHGHEPAGHKH
jgi:F-type H+-transporting ATPase subunit a